MPAAERYSLEPLRRGPSSLIPPPPPDGFVARSLALQQLLSAAGYGHRSGSGVTAAGCRLVSRVARRKRLRDWPHTRTVADYDALLSAVRDHLHARR